MQRFVRRIFFVAFLAPLSAQAKVSLFFYGGLAAAPDSQVVIRQSGGTDITLHDVDWSSDSLRPPLYYGARVVFWLPTRKEAGFGLDFTHTKVSARDTQVVKASGLRAGNRIEGWEPVGNTVEGLGFLHGLNLFLVVMHRRWFAEENFQPYFGAGAGVAMPHMDGKIGNTRGNAFAYGGMAFQAMGGFSQKIYGPLALFAEYKLQRASIDVPYDRNTQVTTTIWVHQGALGLAAHFQ
ncbi:MAG TPA: hypothetical protein VIH99_00125 [Bdellovibrionota bacterium]|jgi:lipid A oxidase